MKTVKHTPTLPSLFDDDIFQGFFSPVVRSNFSDRMKSMPVVDIDETKDGYMLLAEMPGFTKEDISVSLDDGILAIKAEHDEESEKKHNGGSVLKERHYGSYYRSFNFGKNIKEEDITAKYENGVLELVIPKVAQSNQDVKKISIN